MAQGDVVVLPDGTSVVEQADGSYKDASGKPYSAGVVAQFAPKGRATPDPNPKNPYDPQSYTPEQRVELLGNAGFMYQKGSGTGPGARWVTPDARIVTEYQALQSILNPTEQTQRFSGAGLPAGFVQGPEGLVYKQTAGGLRVATDADIAALNAPRYAPPAPIKDVFTDVNGDRVYTVDGAIVAKLPGAEYRKMSPEQQIAAQADAQKRQDDAAMARQVAADAAAMQRASMQEASAFSRQQASEVAAMERARLQEQAAGQRAGFQTVAQLTPQLGQLALEQAGFTRDVLRNPADALARMFFTRGGTSPLPQVSQADIINSLRSNIAGFQSALNEYRPSAGFSAAPEPRPNMMQDPSNPTNFIPVGATPAVGGESTVASGPFQGLRPSQVAGLNTGVWEAAKASEAPQQKAESAPPQMATGGFTKANVVETGDSKDGKPNEEYVIDLPNDGGLMVIPKDRVIGKRKSIPKAADGGYFGFKTPSIPTLDSISQSQLQQWESKVRPPAISAIMAGDQPKPFSIGFNLPSMMAYQSLTPDERQAFGTTLAVQYGITPSDVEKAISDRFSVPTGRLATQRF